MSQEEFEHHVRHNADPHNHPRRKLVILDDLVLDVTLFAQNHPGGRFLIDNNVGKDISKYFHGGYSFEQSQGARQHAHSNYARTIVNSLIVARHVTKRSTAIVRSESTHFLNKGVDEDKPDLKLLKEMEYKLLLNPVVTLTMQVCGEQKLPDTIKSFYPDFDYCGKHYLV